MDSATLTQALSQLPGPISALLVALLVALGVVWRRMEKKDDALISTLTTTVRDTVEVVRANTAAVDRIANGVKDLADAYRREGR